LFKINKNIQDTLSLRVARSGTKKPVTTDSRSCLLRTGGSPVSFMSFVNFSQFNLVFYEFRNCLYFDITHYKRFIGIILINFILLPINITAEVWI